MIEYIPCAVTVMQVIEIRNLPSPHDGLICYFDMDGNLLVMRDINAEIEKHEENVNG